MRKLLYLIFIIYASLHAENIQMSITPQCTAYMNNLEVHIKKRYNVNIYGMKFNLRNSAYQLNNSKRTLSLYKSNEDVDKFIDVGIKRYAISDNLEVYTATGTKKGFGFPTFALPETNYFDFAVSNLGDCGLFSESCNSFPVSIFDDFLKSDTLTVDIRSGDYDLEHDHYNSQSSSTKRYHTTSYNIQNYKEEWAEAKNKCIQQINPEKKQARLEIFYIYAAITISLIIGILIVWFIIKFIKRKTLQFKKSRREDRIRKIAEEESIKASVNQSVSRSNDEELKDLQNLINNAVSKGDSETAEALLKILRKKENLK